MKTVWLISQGHDGPGRMITLRQDRPLRKWVRVLLTPVEMVLFGMVLLWLLIIGFRHVDDEGVGDYGEELPRSQGREAAPGPR